MKSIDLPEYLAKQQGLGGDSQSTIVGTNVAAKQTPVVRVQVPDGMARPWRVQLGPPTTAAFAPGPPPPGGLAFPTWPSLFDLVQSNLRFPRESVICVLTWGTGSARFKAFLDWRNGCAFTVHGSYVDVQVLTPTGFPNSAGQNQEVRFAATITPTSGAPESDEHGPSLTYDAGSIAAGGVRLFAIPPWARRMRLHGPYSGALGDTWSMTFSSFADSTLNSVAIYQHQGTTLRSFNVWDVIKPIPIAPQARTFQLVNSAAAARSCVIEWLLNLG